MFGRKFHRSILLQPHNLKGAVFGQIGSFCLASSRKVGHSKCNSIRDIVGISEQLRFLIKNSKFYRLLHRSFVEFPTRKPSQSASLIRVWAHQFECVLAQRLRRGQQMFCMYTKLWEEHALRELLKKMRQNLARRGKQFLLGALGVYNWERNRIAEASLRSHQDDLAYVMELKEKTNWDDWNSSYDSWSPFIKKKDLNVWRRLHPTGYFEYKVYGSYNDVSASDFLSCQVDIEYRKIWDTTAVVLEAVERDPEPNTNGDIIYWEMLWPKFFSNRDYVFKRRYLIDNDNKYMVIVSESTEHPDYPPTDSKFRIADYYSCMVIRPYTEVTDVGVEFCLTYFDNPGVNIPQYVTTWVAMKAMPDFLEKLRIAAKKYKEYCETAGKSPQCRVKRGLSEKPDVDEDEDWENEYCGNEKRPPGWSDVKYRFDKRWRGRGKSDGETRPDAKPTMANRDSSDANSVTELTATKNDSTIWKYLHPTYYFH